jgi:hypothetical protein
VDLVPDKSNICDQQLCSSTRAVSLATQHTVLGNSRAGMILIHLVQSDESILIESMKLLI